MLQIKNDNIFKFLLIIFITVSLIHIVVATIVQRALTVDGLYFFWELISSKSFYVSYDEQVNMRFFSCLVLELPFLISKWMLGIKNSDVLLDIYSFSLFFMPFIIPLFNFILAKRTKRYDIVALSIILYSLGVIPFIWYSIVEFFLSTSLYLLLFHYLAAEIEYKKSDVFFITLLCIFLFHSHSYVGIFGFMLFFASFLYSKSPDISQHTKNIKLIIGASGLLSACLVWVFYFFSIGPDIKAHGGFIDFFVSMRAFIKFVEFQNPAFLSFSFGFYLFLACLFIKRKFSNLVISMIIALYTLGLACYFYVYKQSFMTAYRYCITGSIDGRYITAVTFSLIILYILKSDFISKHRSRITNFLYNFLIVGLITGISFSLLQIFWSYMYSKVSNTIINEIHKHESLMPDISKTQAAEYYRISHVPMYISIYALPTVQGYKDNMFVLPFDYDKKILYYCYSSSDDKIRIYSNNEDNIREFYELPIYSSVVDLRMVREHLKKQNLYCSMN